MENIYSTKRGKGRGVMKNIEIMLHPLLFFLCFLNSIPSLATNLSKLVWF